MQPAIVAVVIEQDADIPAKLFGYRRMHAPPGFAAQRLELARHAPALRLVLHDEPAIPRPPAVEMHADPVIVLKAAGINLMPLWWTLFARRRSAGLLALCRPLGCPNRSETFLNPHALFPNDPLLS